MDKDIKYTPKKNKGVVNIEIIWQDKQDLIDLGDKIEFSNFILKTSYHAIVKAIDKDLEKVELFNILNVALTVELDKSNFHSVLNKIKDMYITQEDYEECAKIQSTIEKI
jgi:hypothetical protein